MADGGALDPLREGSAEAVSGWLNGAGAAASPATFEFVLSSSDPDDLTLRQARLLGGADAVIHERGVAPEVLDRARADAVRISIAAGEPAPRREGLVIVLRAPTA